MVERLPDDVGALVGVVQGLLIHIDWLSAYGAGEARSASRRTLAIADRLYDILARSAAPLGAARPVAVRSPGTCRDYALLLCSFLRVKRVPARLRCGFASYLGPRWEDHWLCEYFDRETDQ